MKLTTKGLPQGQPSIFFEVEPEAETLAGWMVAYFESQAREGVRFRDGETVQVGWMLLLLREAENEQLEVFEPDFKSMPIRWCRGVNNTVRHLHLQRAVCELFGCELAFPSLSEAGLMSPDFLGSNAYTMSRDASVDFDSGWVFAERGYNGDQGEYCSLYQLSLSKPEIVPFLALPASSLVRVEPGYREVSLNSTIKSSVDSELLQKLVAADVMM